MRQVPLGDKEIQAINEGGIQNSRPIKDGMLNTTRQIFNEFYAPFNRELANILNNDKFLWQ